LTDPEDDGADDEVKGISSPSVLIFFI
jgi:hypothetical protein